MIQLNKKNLDGILVLGPGRAPDCVYESRERIAVDYVNGRYNGRIPVIVSGGKGLYCDNWNFTEAEKLRKGLQHKGIKGVIEIEDRSKTTIENYENSAPFVHIMGMRKMGVVTNSACMRRQLDIGKEIFNEKGIECEITPCYRRNWNFGDVLSEFLVLGYEVAKALSLFEHVDSFKRYFSKPKGL